MNSEMGTVEELKTRTEKEEEGSERPFDSPTLRDLIQ
jgi:hypothetical protein